MAPSRPGKPEAGADSSRIEALPIAARRHPLVAHIERKLCSRCGMGGLQGEVRIVVGISGGADSAALLLACAAIGQHDFCEGGRLIPVAAHVHHHLRDSADDDAAWVENLAKTLGIEVLIEHVRPKTLEGNLAANARRLRYEALEAMARKVEASHIAVAHHGDDQLETILMALGRGAGLEGLTGMQWRRELGKGMILVRPMLDSRHAEAEELCRTAGVEWREDPGNLDPSSARARVRRDLAPVLEELWPDAARRITGTGDLVAAARLTLERQLQTVFGEADERKWVRRELAGLPEAILASGLRRAALHAAPEAGDALGQRHLLETASAIGDDEKRPRTFEWPGGLTVSVTSKQVEMKRD